LSVGWPRVYVIGLTGNIATGKSTVCQMLARLGARIIDADQLAHQALEPGSQAWEAVVARFGRGVLQPDGQVDRGKLGEVVFADPLALKELEGIVHPAVIARSLEIMARATEPVVVLDAIKLIESGMAQSCDAVWVVTCTPQQQAERLMAGRGLSEEAAWQRIRAQPRAEEKLEHATVVIDNSGPREETWKQVREAWERIAPRKKL